MTGLVFSAVGGTTASAAYLGAIFAVNGLPASPPHDSVALVVPEFDYVSQIANVAASEFASQTYTLRDSMSESERLLVRFSGLITAIKTNFPGVVISAELNQDPETYDDVPILRLQTATENAADIVACENELFAYVATRPALERDLLAVTLAFA